MFSDLDYEKRQTHIKREKEIARKLRKSAWWQNKLRHAVCYYCQANITADEATMDHIVPLSRGGKSQKGNIAVSCKDCNTKKKDKTAVELLTSGDDL